MSNESKKTSTLAWEWDIQTAAWLALWHYHHLGIADGLAWPQDLVEPMNNVPDSPVPLGMDRGIDHAGGHATNHGTAPSLMDGKPVMSEKVTTKKLDPSILRPLPPSPPLAIAQSQGCMGLPPQTLAEKELALLQLSKKMAAFSDLSICQTAKNMVFADGNPHAGIMLVGEAPGAEEDLQGKPFVGASGKLLNAMLASIGLNRTVTYIANVVPWRPPFNRQPSNEEIRACLPFLQEHIHIVQPRVIVCVGGVASKALLCLTQTLTESQGQLLSYHSPFQSETIPAWTLYHPAYLMRSPGQKKVAWQQLLCIQAFLDSIGLVYRAQSGDKTDAKS